MTISTRLKIAALLPIGAAALVLLVISLFSRTLEDTRERNVTAARIINEVHELSTLAYSYLLVHNERSQQQFMLRHTSISALLDTLSPVKGEQQYLLRSIRKNHGTVRSTFLKLVESYERLPHGRNSALSGEAEQRLAGHLSVRLKEMSSDAFRLSTLIIQDMHTTQRAFNTLISLLSVATAAVVSLILAGMTRSVIQSIEKLRKGAEIIGTGDLDHRTGLTGSDEIGQLSRAFDRMTEQLQTVTVSKDALVHEITERERAEESIRSLNAQLEQKLAELDAANKELEAFSYSASHDLRAPLRSIEGFSRALLEDCSDRLDEQGMHYLRRIRTASRHMADLIENVLKLSHITRYEMKTEPVDLSELVHELAAELAEAEPGRRVELSIQNGIIAHGDMHLLRILLDNLVRNAWKFTGKQAAARIEFGMTDGPGGNRVFYLRDNGAGFDKNYASKLFIPFQRLHSPSEFPGTGIGLATVQRIINRHGGRVWAEGEPGKGATFSFTL